MAHVSQLNDNKRKSKKHLDGGVLSAILAVYLLDSVENWCENCTDQS